MPKRMKMLILLAIVIISIVDVVLLFGKQNRVSPTVTSSENKLPSSTYANVTKVEAREEIMITLTIDPDAILVGESVSVRFIAEVMDDSDMGNTLSLYDEDDVLIGTLYDNADSIADDNCYTGTFELQSDVRVEKSYYAKSSNGIKSKACDISFYRKKTPEDYEQFDRVMAEVNKILKKYDPLVDTMTPIYSEEALDVLRAYLDTEIEAGIVSYYYEPGPVVVFTSGLRFVVISRP